MLWGTPRAMACDAKGTAYAGRKRFSLQRPLLEQQIIRGFQTVVFPSSNQRLARLLENFSIY